ncbi:MULTISPECIES: hypothetical protein [Streptomyces]|uniref:hypothetical protein n=1 Tax=Streptomyces TaxID=1883 RepID=UPI00369DF54E
MNRGEIWTLPDGRNVLLISLTGLEEACGAVLALVLHYSGRYPDTAMSVVIGDPLPCTAVAPSRLPSAPPPPPDGNGFMAPMAGHGYAQPQRGLPHDREQGKRRVNLLYTRRMRTQEAFCV